MREYRKQWWPFAAWTLALLPVMIGAAEIAGRAGMDSRGIVAWMMIVVIAMLLLLLWMIWKGEYVYWISGGPSFEEAKAAGSEVRREYAWKHFSAMLKGGAAALILLAAECALKAHALVMLLSTAVCIVAAAVSTVKIRWREAEHDLQN